MAGFVRRKRDPTGSAVRVKQAIVSTFWALAASSGLSNANTRVVGWSWTPKCSTLTIMGPSKAGLITACVKGADVLGMKLALPL